MSIAVSRCGDSVGLGVPAAETPELLRECRPSVGLWPGLRLVVGLGGPNNGVIAAEVSIGGSSRKPLDEVLLVLANDGLGCKGVVSVKS